MDEQTAPATEAPQEAAEAPQIDNAALMARMDELAGEVKGLRGTPTTEYRGLGDALNPQQQEPDFDPALADDPNGFDPYAVDPQAPYDPYGQQPDPQAAQAQAMQQLQSFISEQVQQGVQQQVTPWIHQQEVSRLESQYPDLKNPEVVGPLVEEAQRFAQQLGQPSLATSPAMIEKLYLAQQASQRAAQETPADGDKEVHLEGSGAAQPQQQSSEEEDLVARVVNAGSADAGGRAFWT